MTCTIFNLNKSITIEIKGYQGELKVWYVISLLIFWYTVNIKNYRYWGSIIRYISLRWIDFWSWTTFTNQPDIIYILFNVFTLWTVMVIIRWTGKSVSVIKTRSKRNNCLLIYYIIYNLFTMSFLKISLYSIMRFLVVFYFLWLNYTFFIYTFY